MTCCDLLTINIDISLLQSMNFACEVMNPGFFMLELNSLSGYVLKYIRPLFHGQFFFTKNVCRRKLCSCKFNSVAKFHCQISVTKVS